MVIFAGGKYRGRNFPQYYSYFLHKGICVLYSRGDNFSEEDKSANAKITPRENVHVYSSKGHIYCVTESNESCKGTENAVMVVCVDLHFTFE